MNTKIFALAAGCSYGVYLVLTRTIAGSFRPRFLLLSQLLIGAVLLAPIGVGVAVPVLEASFVSLILISAFGSMAGNYLLVLANKRAEASLIAPLVYAVPVQLLAYHTACVKGTDVDQPRNLAKSVTVE